MTKSRSVRSPQRKSFLQCEAISAEDNGRYSIRKRVFVGAATMWFRSQILRDAGRRVSFPFANVSGDSTMLLLPPSSCDR